jgi:glutamyl-tRNA reductase
VTRGVELGVVGISHHTAPLEVRERFLRDDSVLGALRASPALRGAHALLLSTCNRTELYIAGADGAQAAAHARAVLAAGAGYDVATAAKWLYERAGRDAVRHLFRVAGGLDSLVVGEAQIQGQVRSAHEKAAAAARARDPSAAVLGRLFDSALCIGGRIRSETMLGVGAASVPSASVELARKIFGSLRGRRAAVVGAGEMSALALRCLTAEGVEHAVIAGRTRARTAALAQRTGAAVAELSELPELIATCDIILTATSAPGMILHAADAAAALSRRGRGPILLVDIALPRDVHPDVGTLEGVFLYDLDDLQAVVAGTLDRRREEIAHAERIVDEGVADFWSWYRARDAVPVIREIRGRAEALRRRELERTLRSLQHLPAADRAAVENLTRQLLAKLLHEPTARLREAAASEQHDAAIVAAARYLFAIDQDTERSREASDTRRNGETPEDSDNG